ncbi:biosynthesis cobalamin cbim cobalt precursor signal nickel membrane abc protein [Trichococcus palustris]|uniref:Biosynthesis cobalamin cbim cobalt signal nickel membrane abc protein n=1 Tax=Trichococcus palustris TaxID=140314 RepID=A0A143Y9I2_9LACT|nr:cobalt transporter CbiM [Trichococcus palustris]CZQ85192.1 biosynthesis cobalamin cbim cobalt precursor signal nickel membrane abc protein [Trichococcus palustris]SFK55246.1 cobalt/nickel transport system permease protein [Trichococcus palustris]
MHIPDNYLSPSTSIMMGATMIPIWTIAIKKVKAEVPKTKLPLLGVGAAFTFLLMMFNVPLPGGTTGHAVGGTLIALLLGPYAACLSITIALLIQALLFGDGGILAFGANCFNMAFLLPFAGYFIFQFIKSKAKTEKGEYFGIAAGSYLGLNLAALCVAVEFGIQPLLFTDARGQPLYSPYPLSVAIPAITIPHLLVVGIVEALVSVEIYKFIKRVSPDMIHKETIKQSRAIYALIVALICLTPLGLLATGTAWGEWDKEEIQNTVANGKALGYIPAGLKNGFSFEAIMPDYKIAGLSDATGYLLSAVAGVAISIIAFKIIGSLKKRRSAKDERDT